MVATTGLIRNNFKKCAIYLRGTPGRMPKRVAESSVVRYAIIYYRWRVGKLKR